MFDVGFWELCLVGLVSLLVIGPEKLPQAARVAGFWVGKARNMVASVKAEIKQELQAEEMRQIMQQQAGLEEAQQLLDDASNVVNDINSSVKSLTDADVQEKPTDESK